MLTPCLNGFRSVQCGAADPGLSVAHVEHAAALQASQGDGHGRAHEEDRHPAQEVKHVAAEAAAYGADSIMTPAQASVKTCAADHRCLRRKVLPQLQHELAARHPQHYDLGSRSPGSDQGWPCLASGNRIPLMPYSEQTCIVRFSP